MASLLVIVSLIIPNVIHVQASSECNIVANTDCYQGSYDLMSYNLVQTFSPNTQCIGDRSSDQFYLDYISIEFDIQPIVWSGEITIDYTIFQPDTLQSFSTALATAPANHIASGILYILPDSSLTTIEVQTSLSCYNVPNIGIFLEATSWPSSITSLTVTECASTTEMRSGSKLKYYSPKTDFYTVFDGVSSVASNNKIMKISPFLGSYYENQCNSSSTGSDIETTTVSYNTYSSGICGDDSVEGMCVNVYNCRDAILNDPILSAIGSGWIQFLDVPSSCAMESNPLYINDIVVYLLNDFPTEGFSIKFQMKLYAIDDGSASAANIASGSYSNLLFSQNSTLDDVMMASNYNYDNDYYELWFSMDTMSTFPLYGQECPQTSDCLFYFELKVIDNDRVDDDIGPTLIGCYYQSDAMTFEVETAAAVDTVTEADSYHRTTANSGTQFDIVYDTNAYCGDNGASDITNTNCTGDWRYFVEMKVSVTGSTPKAKWMNHEDLVQDMFGFAMFDTLREYTEYNIDDYCYNPHVENMISGGAVATMADCGCFAVDAFTITVVDAQIQFGVRYAINSDLFDVVTSYATSGIVDDTIIQTQLLMKIYDQMNNPANYIWYDSTSSYNIESFELIEESLTTTQEAEECVDDDTFYVITSIEVNDASVSDDEWITDQDSIQNNVGISLYNTLQEIADENNYCFNPDSDTDCGCFAVSEFMITTDDDNDVIFEVQYAINADLYNIVSEDDWLNTEDNIEASFITQLSSLLSDYGSNTEFTLAEFNVASGILCGSDTGTMIEITIEISTSIDINTWKLNQEDVNSVFVDSFINSIYVIDATIIAADCLTVSEIDIESVSDDDDDRRRLSEADTISIKVEIVLNQDAYDEIFGEDGFDTNEDIFADVFIEAFKNEIETNYGDDWYTDDDAAISYQVSDANDDNQASMNFIDFRDKPLQAGITGIVLLAVFIAIFGYFNSWFRGADNFMIASVFFFGLYTWDFFSDVFFAAFLYDSQLSKMSPFSITNIYSILFILSLIFIIFPVVKNIIDLLSFQSKWMLHPLHADRYKAWINQYMNILFLLSVISGSTFGAIALVNSNFLGWRLFAMGLSQKDMREFNQRRLWNVIVGENLPQLLIQIIFTGISEGFELIAFLAICSSSLSIAAALFAFASNKKFLEDKMVHESMFSVKVTSKQIDWLKKSGYYKNKTYVLATEIARMFALDRNTVEMLPSEKFSDKQNDGLVLYFFISTSKIQPAEIYGDLKESIACQENEKISHLGRQIARAWNLKHGDECDENKQLITYDLKWMNGEATNKQRNVVSTLELQEDNYKAPDNNDNTTAVDAATKWETIEHDNDKKDTNKKEEAQSANAHTDEEDVL